MDVEIFLENELNFKLDMIDVCKRSGTIKLKLYVAFMYPNSTVSYSDELWFQEDTIQDFMKNLNLGKECMLENIDQDFYFNINKNNLIIKINKKAFDSNNNTNLTYEINIKNTIYKIKDAFDSLNLG